MLVNKKFPLKHLPCNSNLFVIIHLWFSCKPVWYAINSIYSSFVMQNYHLCFIIHSLQKTSIACTSSQVFLRTLHQGNYSVLFTHIYCVHKFLAISSLLLLSHKRKSFNNKNERKQIVRKFFFSFSLLSDIFCSDFYFFILFFILVFYFVLWCLRAYKTLECKANVSTQIQFLFVNFLHYYCSSYKIEKYSQVKIRRMYVYADLSRKILDYKKILSKPVNKLVQNPLNFTI